MKDFKMPDTAAIIANVLVMSIVGLVYLLALLGHTDTDIFKILVGGLMSVGFTNIVGFYFGSSKGSKDKDETISNVVAAQSAQAKQVETGRDDHSQT